MTTDGVRDPLRHAAGGDEAGAPAGEAALAGLCQRLVMETWAPAAVLVNRKNECLYALGPTDRYLRVPPGRPTHDLLALARKDLRGKLRSAIQQARQANARIVTAGERTDTNGEETSFSIAVQPVLHEGEPLLFICFADERKPARRRHRPGGAGDDPQIAALEQELAATRTELQGAIHNLETASEEQKAINEEALSVNEEYPVDQRGAADLEGRTAVAERGADRPQQPASGNAGAAAHDLERPAERPVQHRCRDDFPRYRD